MRVWRASHFGGHVFAPTLIDLPSGLYWAYVTPAQAEPIVARSGKVQNLFRQPISFQGGAGELIFRRGTVALPGRESPAVTELFI